jgi:hypothetical protein
MEFEIDYFWTSKGLISIHVATSKNFLMNLHILPQPSSWLFGKNKYWEGQPVLDFGMGPLFRMVCAQL